MARLIAGEDAQPGELHYARIAASATFQIGHIRSLRASLLEPAARQREVYSVTMPRRVRWTIKYKPPKPWVLMRSARLQEMAFQQQRDLTMAEKLEQYTTARRHPPPPPPGLDGELVLLQRAMATVLRLDRYERRELSRRKNAIRQLDNLRATRKEQDD